MHDLELKDDPLELMNETELLKLSGKAQINAVFDNCKRQIIKDNISFDSYNEFYEGILKAGANTDDLQEILYIASSAKQPFKSLFIANMNKPSYRTLPENTLANFNPFLDTIYVDFAGMREHNNYTTFFHEFGHAIDDLATPWGSLSTKKNDSGEYLFDLMQSDVRKHLENNISSVTNESDVKARIIESIMNRTTTELSKSDSDLLTIFQNNYMDTLNEKGLGTVSDAFNGITNRTISGNSGHWIKEDGNFFEKNLSENYWYVGNNFHTGSQEKELWAGYYADQMLGNEGKYDEFLPQSKQFLDDLANRMK